MITFEPAREVGLGSEANLGGYSAFLSSGIASGVSDLIGEPYADGSGNQYAAMFRQPVTILTGCAQELGACVCAGGEGRSVQRDLHG